MSLFSVTCHKRPLIALACLFLFSSASYCCAEEITVVADRWCPFNCEPASPNPGILMEPAITALKEAGYTVHYEIVPWSRAISDTRSGKYDAIVGAAESDAPDFIFPTVRGAHSSTEFWVKKGDNWKYTDTKSLKGRVIAVIQDYSYGEEVDGYIQENLADPAAVQVATGDEALQKNIAKLLLGRVSAVMEDRAVILYTLDKMNKKNELISAGKVKEQDLFVAFSPAKPRSKELAEIISRYTKKQRESGDEKQLLEKYGLFE